ncbi:hypothetical protein ARMGADRAFT_1083024 [Armillaria gallica]|uniref:Retrotransposon gag domain-containing protein n=1 Tax=Armillaria gallica TaxID=47427 RepID=A0A2H3D8N7_ARMGA|nr:hypothetical protein ARMGADRAFT_1083024 [Armillaria gallica]
MVPDQGIAFDKNNNPWIKPTDDSSPGEHSPPSQKLDDWKGNHGRRDNEPPLGPQQGRCSSGPPDDDEGSDSSSNNRSDHGRRDSFTPRFTLRGVSMAPMTSWSLENKAKHMERKFQQIVEFIKQNLEHKLSIPDGAKGTRLDVKNMKKYDGTASREILWEWLRSVVFSYCTSQLGGPDRDEEQVLILDMLLEGWAKMWFQLKITKPGVPKPLFVKIIINLYIRFIHDSALQDARDAFRAVRWDDEDNTVQGWKDTIQQLIDDMDVAPDEYAVKVKFMFGLPPPIRNGVFADKLSVEYNDLEELYQSTLDIEYALRAEH